MFEPVTLSLVAQSFATSQIVGSVIGGWLGNRSDHYLCKAYNIVFERLKNESEPVNHDIQRAVREAYLKATLVTCQRLLKRKYTVIDQLLHFDTWDLKDLVGYLKKQLRQLQKATFVHTADPIATDYTLLLQSRNVSAQERIGDLKRELRRQVVAELTKTGYLVEDDLKKAIMDGWTEDGKPLDWYDLVCAYFTENLKTNERLRTIVQTELLQAVQQGVQEINLTMGDFQAQADRFGQTMQAFLPVADEFLALLDQIDAKLDRVADAVEAGNVITHDRLADLQEKVATLQPQSPARAKYLNTFAHYDLDNLVGRQQQLADMDAHFATHRLLLLRGMGGIGKTTLARAFISSRADGFDHIAYVEITSTIADALLDRLGTSPDVLISRDPQKDTEANLRDLIEVLRHLPNMLLVIDNANDADDLRLRKAVFDSLPGRVLVTSRARVQTYQQARNVLEVKQLTPDEARQLFGKLYGPLTDAETKRVDDILRQTDYHPKLVEVLAKAARENSLFELSTLETIVARKDYDHADISYPVELGEAEKPVYRILLDLFDTDPLDEATRQLLRYFSVLPTIDIPVRHLVDLLGLTDPGEQRTLVETLKKLTRSGWLDDLDNRVFAMHGLVQWVVRQRLQPTLDNCNALISGAARLTYRLNETNPLKAWPYVPYADALLAIFETDQNGPLTTLYGNTAVTYGALGQQDKRLAYNLKALAIREAVLPADHPDLATSFNNIAGTYGALGQHDNALAYNLKALAIFEAVLPADHPNLAISFNNVAVTYGALGQQDKQLAYNLKALAIREAVLPTDHPDLAQSFNNIAGTYGALGQQDKQLVYNLKALAIFEAVLPADHPNLAQSFNNVAGTYGALGQQDKQLVYNLKALAIWEAVLPTDHPDLARSFSNIAVTYGALGQQDKELEYNLKALAIREAVLPTDHPDLATSFSNIAETYRALGQYDEALAYNLKALAIWEAVLPADHPNLATSFNNIALTYGALG